MQAVVIGCGLVILLVAVFVLWWSRNPIVFTAAPGSFPEVTARQLDSSSSQVLVEARLSGQTEGYQVTEISAQRVLVELLGLAPPLGFVEEPLPLSDRERKDAATLEWVNDWNRENIRWVGPVPIHPGQPLLLDFPATSPQAATGQLSISYERKGRLGGTMSATFVTINKPVADTAEPRPSTDEEGAAEPINATDSAVPSSDPPV